MKTVNRNWVRFIVMLVLAAMLCGMVSSALAYDDKWKLVKLDVNDFILVDSVEKVNRFDTFTVPGGEEHVSTANERENAINEYIWGIDPGFANGKIDDHYVYSNRVNNSRQINPSQVETNIILTEQILAAEPEYVLRSKTMKVIPATGASGNNQYIYPGNILSVSNHLDEIVMGEFTNLNVGRAAGHFNLQKGKDLKFSIDNMSYKPNGSAFSQPYFLIENEIYDGLDKIRNGNPLSSYYVVRTANVSSPEQLVSTLRVTMGELDQAIDSAQWDLIRTGQIQMVAVSVEQVLCSVVYTNEIDSNPAGALFSTETTAETLQNTILNHANAMVIRQVNYGRRYLLTLTLNLACSPHEERLDLKGGIDAFFSGRSVSDEGTNNALSYAACDGIEIGLHNTNWEKITDYIGTEKLTLSDFANYLSRNKNFNGEADEQCLVPISYAATALGGSMTDPFKMIVNANEHAYIGKKAEKVTGITFDDNSVGQNYHRDFVAYGLDIDAFNTNQVFKEKKYTVTTSDAWNLSIPAYKNIFGIAFNLDGGVTSKRGNVYIKTVANDYDKDINDNWRIYNGWGIVITDDDGDKLKARKVLLDNAKIYLDCEEVGGGYDRNRVNSDIQVLDVDPNETTAYSPLFTKAAHQTIGWGTGYSFLKYEGYYEQAGRNLDLTNEAIGMSMHPQFVSEICEQQEKPLPQTGDNSHITLMIIMLVLSAGLGLCLSWKKQKKGF